MIVTLEMECVKSERSGMSSMPRPPSLRGVFIQAKWVKWESTEQATTWNTKEENKFHINFQNEIQKFRKNISRQNSGVFLRITSAPMALNSATLSLNARISVGQTNVKSSG